MNQNNKILASIIIPVYNGVDVLKQTLKMVLAQKVSFPYEILVIDSGSTDGSVDIIRQFPSVRLHQIPPQEFGHGKTRNLGAQLSSGEFIVFLTQDACPANEYWLQELIKEIEKDDSIAGVFGKHLAYQDADVFTKRDMVNHFNHYASIDHPVDKFSDIDRYNKDINWRLFCWFYSDNNSCLRRSVWEKIPYRDIDYGEDQVWAMDIIEAGYKKSYADNAVVYHSHNYGFLETVERAITEQKFYYTYFGFSLYKGFIKTCIKIMYEFLKDFKYSLKCRSLKQLPKQFIKIIAKYTGYCKGYTIS